jgi:hypothetical protein
VLMPLTVNSRTSDSRSRHGQKQPIEKLCTIHSTYIIAFAKLGGRNVPNIIRTCWCINGQ